MGGFSSGRRSAIGSPLPGFRGGTVGGGSANDGALLRQTGETTQGLFISAKDADPSWHLRGVERQLREEATPAQLEYLNQDQDASVTVRLPTDWIVPPESANLLRVSNQIYSLPRDAISAVYDVGRTQIVSSRIGPAGNEDLATVEAGLTAQAVQNGHATVVGRRGTEAVPLPGGDILVRSPNFGAGATANAQLLRVGDVYLNVVWNTKGDAGNGFRIQIQNSSAVTSGQAAPSVDRDSQNNVIGITVGVRGTVQISAIVTALNGVSVNSTQLVTASLVGAASASRAFLSSSTDESTTLVGGSDYGQAASGTVAGQVSVSYYLPGDAGNGIEVLLDKSSGTVGAVNVQYVRADNGRIQAAVPPLSNFGGVRLLVNGSTQRTAIRDAINGVVIEGRQVLVATGGSGSINYVNSGQDEDVTLSGGSLGSGSGTNDGGVTVTRAAGGDPAVAATATADAVDDSDLGVAPTLRLNFAPNGNPSRFITLTGDTAPVVGGTQAFARGTATVVARDFSGTTRGGEVHQVARDGNQLPTMSIQLEGTWTAQQLVDLINGYTSAPENEGITASLGGTTGTDSATWTNLHTARPAQVFSAGTGGKGRLTGQGVKVTHPTAGADGNNATIRMSRGSADGATKNGKASINGAGGSSLVVVSPNGQNGEAGTGTNTGRVRVVRGAARANAVAATATIDGKILITAATPGAGGNGFDFRFYSQSGGTAGEMRLSFGNRVFTVEVNTGSNTYPYAPALNVGDVIDLLDARSEITATVAGSTSRSDTISPSFTGNNRDAFRTDFSGGSDGTNALSVSWNSSNNTLTITNAQPTDTLLTVLEKIDALSEFTRTTAGDSNRDAAGRAYQLGGDATSTITTPGTAGQAFGYNFSGGTSGRSPLAADWTSPLLHVTGILPGDTVQDVIDVINALSNAPTAAAVGNTLDAANDGIFITAGAPAQDYNFTGGRDGSNHTVHAAYTAATNTLALTVLPSDTLDAVMDAVAALSQFQRSRGGQPVDGSMPGDLWISDDATTLDTIVTPTSSSAAALEYDYSGGHDARDRSVLTVTDAEESAPATASIGFVGPTEISYYVPGGGGNGFSVLAQARYNPNISTARASGTVTLGGKTVTFRGIDNDTYWNGWTVRFRRTAGAGFQTQTSPDDQRITYSLPDGTYTLQEIINLVARGAAIDPRNNRIVFGIASASVASADLTTSITVSSSFTTLDTTAWAGASSATDRVIAEYTSDRSMTVTYETNAASSFTTFPNQGEMRDAINAARWEGTQLVTATDDGGVGAGPTIRWSSGPTDGQTQAIAGGAFTLAGGSDGSNHITVSGLIGADSANDLIAAYSGTRFTITPSARGTGRFTEVAGASFSGGRPPLGRRAPNVVMTQRGGGAISVALIAHDDNTQNTTLQELTQAWWDATYELEDGTVVPFPFSNITIDTSGGGALTDPVRAQILPIVPTGGENLVPEGPIEALIRADDEVQGPNVEVRYHADHDTLQEVLDALLAQNDVGIVETYGTDLTAVPEDPPFIRSMAPAQGDTTINVTGGSNVRIEDEGADLGEAQTLNFTGAGVNVTGAGTEKQVSIRGVDSNAQRQVVDDEITTMVKPFARTDGPQVPDSEIPNTVARDSEIKDFAKTGGPEVPDSEIPDTIARDSEAAANLFQQLVTQTLSASETDEVPFFAGGQPRKTTTQLLRGLMKGYVGAWADTPGFFVFRAGDLTDHNGRLYWVIRQSTKDSSDGPETNADFQLLTPFAGTWTAGWFKAGTSCLYTGGVYFAVEDVVQSDGNPATSTKWARIDGAADSIVTVDVSGAELVATTRGGQEQRKTLPSGGTNVTANPTGTGGDPLTRLEVAGTDYSIPAQSRDTYMIWWEESQGPVSAAANKNSGRQWSLGNGATGQPIYIPFDCEVISLSLTIVHSLAIPVTPGSSQPARVEILETTVGFETPDFDAEVTETTPTGTAIADLEITIPANSTGWQNKALFVPAADSPITISAGTYLRPVSTAPAAPTPAQGMDTASVLTLALRRTGTDSPAPSVHPHVSSFRATSGNLNPVAGSIAAQVFGVDWTIAQSDHAGSARILGFKGAIGDGTPTVLVTIPAGNIPHGSGNAVIPNGTTLADGETYTLRLQVFSEGVTNPGIGAAPASYQDVRIVAHAAAAAAYHVGYVAYDSDDADAAATAARIVDFTNDTATATAIPSTITVALPDASEYQIYLLAKADQAQPSGFTNQGQNASASFYAAQDKTISSVTYKAYILKPLFRLTNANNGQTFGVTP